MRVLVVYGPAHGSTADVAGLLAFALRVEGFDAAARAACEVDELTDVDAVVVGGLVCMGRWHGDARRFVRRHRAALTALPVWLFSCGSPRDCGAETPLVAQVRVLMDRVHARGHAGLDDRLPGIARQLTAAGPTHDAHDLWRDPEQLTGFVRRIAAELHHGQPQQV